MKLIEGWRQAGRLWSLRVSAFGATVFTALLAFPDAALALWNAMPAEIQELVPNRTAVAIALFATSAIARVLRQRGATDD